MLNKTIEQKLDYFYEAILQESTRVAKNKINTQEAAIKESVNTALTEARAEMQALEQEEARKEKIAGYKQIAAFSSKMKTHLHKLRNNYTQTIFEKVEAELRLFAASDAYKGYMEEKIRDAAEKSGFSVVQLSPRDINSGLVLPANLTVEATEADFIGGFILLDASRKKRINFSFLANLNKAREAYGHR